VYFEIVGNVTSVEIIAVGRRIRQLARLRKAYGRGRWRKLKGIAVVRLADGSTIPAEVHWYEAHNIGKKEFKIKRFL
jgi:hypothetical protein